MKKTLLDQEIDKAMDHMQKFTETHAYDSGVRDVMLEGYIAGLHKAKRLVNKQKRLALSTQQSEGKEKNDN